MKAYELRREINYLEYLRLLQDANYYDVTFDEKSGGMSAIHNRHIFDKQKGAMGYRRGNYELSVVRIMRSLGYGIVLGSEKGPDGVKMCDGLLNGHKMDIKSVEGDGKWSICRKLLDAEKQGASALILFFPNEINYYPRRVADGIEKYSSSPVINQIGCVKHILVIEGQSLVEQWQKNDHSQREWSLI